MNVEIGAEAELFPENKYINGIAVAVCNMENKVLCDEQVFEQIRPCGGGGGGDGDGEGPGGGHQAHKAEDGGVHHFGGGSLDVRNRAGNFRNRKLSEFLSEPFLGREKCLDFCTVGQK